MICRLPHKILHRIAKYILTCSKDTSKSWFFHIRSLCFQYGLPHPLILLESPPPKESSKKTIKSKVVDFWEKKLRQSSDLPSLTYFKPDYMSLTTTHPLWTTCASNSFELSKAVIQAKLLSGRYRSDRLLRHFSKDQDGFCKICSLNCEGTIEHLLVECVALSEHRQQQFHALKERDDISEVSKELIHIFSQKGTTDFTQLLLDCSVIPEVISASQIDISILHEIFKFT